VSDTLTPKQRAEALEKLKREGNAAHFKKEQEKKAALKANPDKSKNDGFEGIFNNIITQDYSLEDTVIAPPQPTPGMFYGMVGEVASIAAAGTEINPVSAAMVYLSFLGANAGRDAFLFINNTYHHPRLFTLHIGRSGRGGKGDSQQLVHRIRKRIEERDSMLLGKIHTGGLSSREGLAALIHDGYGETPAIIDKRIWIIESEFANVLHQSKREGNTLSTAIRQSFDGDDIKPATKSKPIGASNPHIGIHANITPAELTGLLNSREMSNGFANRFLMIYAENVGSVPFPSSTPERLVDELTNKTMDIIHFAKGGYPNSINGVEMSISQAAKDLYANVYRELQRPLESDYLASMLERIRPYSLRLAMLFAITDQTRVIEDYHLQAALEWIRYGINTVKFIFADKYINQQQAETRQSADKIMAFLQLSPKGCSMTELNNSCFQKHSSGKEINAALNYLLTENPPRIKQIIEAPGSKGGRPKTIYKFKIGAEKAEKLPAHDLRGLQPILNCGITADKLRTNSEQQVHDTVSPQFVRNEKNTCNPELAGFESLSAFSAPNIFSADEKTTPKRPTKPRKPRVKKGGI
jgi:hypothetical protein